MGVGWKEYRGMAPNVPYQEDIQGGLQAYAMGPYSPYYQINGYNTYMDYNAAWNHQSAAGANGHAFDIARQQLYNPAGNPYQLPNSQQQQQQQVNEGISILRQFEENLP